VRKLSHKFYLIFDFEFMDVIMRDVIDKNLFLLKQGLFSMTS